MLRKRWNQECLRWHGRVLEGKHQHCCHDWDYLPIDDTCAELECCTCIKELTHKIQIRFELFGKYYMMLWS